MRLKKNEKLSTIMKKGTCWFFLDNIAKLKPKIPNCRISFKKLIEKTVETDAKLKHLKHTYT